MEALAERPRTTRDLAHLLGITGHARGLAGLVNAGIPIAERAGLNFHRAVLKVERKGRPRGRGADFDAFYDAVRKEYGL